LIEYLGGVNMLDARLGFDYFRSVSKTTRNDGRRPDQGLSTTRLLVRTLGFKLARDMSEQKVDLLVEIGDPVSPQVGMRRYSFVLSNLRDLDLSGAVVGFETKSDARGTVLSDVTEEREHTSVVKFEVAIPAKLDFGGTVDPVVRHLADKLEVLMSQSPDVIREIHIGAEALSGNRALITVIIPRLPNQ
jgi:hypothetical protein